MDEELSSKLMNTAIASAIGAALAYWAYETAAHAVLFGYVIFAVCGIRNNIIGELRGRRT